MLVQPSALAGPAPGSLDRQCGPAPLCGGCYESDAYRIERMGFRHIKPYPVVPRPSAGGGLDRKPGRLQAVEQSPAGGIDRSGSLQRPPGLRRNPRKSREIPFQKPPDIPCCLSSVAGIRATRSRPACHAGTRRQLSRGIPWHACRTEATRCLRRSPAPTGESACAKAWWSRPWSTQDVSFLSCPGLGAGAVDTYLYCEPNDLISASSCSHSSPVRSVRGGRTGPAPRPTSVAPAFTMLTA